MKKPAIEVKNVVKKYGDVLGVGPISFSVEKGEFLTLLGPSGCGKTTTLRMIAGLEQPTQGEIFIDGKNMDQVPPNQRDVGMVFQNYALFPHMTVSDNLKFGLDFRKVSENEKEEKVKEMLSLVGLSGFGSRYPKELSGGQQQRVGLARALIINPTVLLLDEPLSNLDVKLRLEMRAELNRIRKRLDVTALYVTHDQEEALSMSDTIAVLKNGEVIQLGNPVDIYESPKSEFVADFIGYSNIMSFKIISKENDKFHCVSEQGLEIYLYETSINSTLDLKNEDQLLCLLRPDRIGIEQFKNNEMDISESNQYLGIVNEVLYLGADIHFHVTLSRCTEKLLIISKAKAEIRQIKEGEKVKISIDPDSSISLILE